MAKPWYLKFFSTLDQDNHQAIRAKADRGDADAQFGLGQQYSRGIGLAPDLAQAAHWYQRAADQNHSLAQFHLGLLYAKGQGVLRDDATALRLIRQAAGLGQPAAQFNLGARCERASFEPLRADSGESKIEAYKWFHLGATQGDMDSLMARERLNLLLTPAQVAEGSHRATVFLTAQPDTVAA